MAIAPDGQRQRLRGVELLLQAPRSGLADQ